MLYKIIKRIIVAPTEIQAETLEGEIRHIEQQARMMLPGIQAFFGFQLIVVFNQNFKLFLTPAEQMLHLLALILSSLAILLVLTPAAYHRTAEPGLISRRLIKISSTFLAWGMVPLVLGIVLDLYIVIRVTLDSQMGAALISFLVFMAYVGLWFVFPSFSRRFIIKEKSR